MYAIDSAHQQVLTQYGHQLRLRVCGLYVENDKLLMVRHRGINTSNTFWCPPGGGLQYGESSPEALRREFAEETGLDVQVGSFLFVNEFRQPPLHAIELFFRVERAGHGQLKTGSDPEMSVEGQIIDEVRLMSFDEIKQLPADNVHSLFQHCQTLEDVFRLRGYWPR